MNRVPAPEDIPKPGSLKALLWAHFQIARLDHWSKNVFVLPGILIPLLVEPRNFSLHLLWNIVIGLLAVGLVASSNYVLNEVLDAPYDRFHPTKRNRPAARGAVNFPLAYGQWLVLMAGGLWLAMLVSWQLAVSAAALWLMGCIYNIPPLRTKDLPYLDVMSEAVNNPLRLFAGWYMVSTTVPPASLLVSYWMVGCYFMAIKRFSEFREHGGDESLAFYRNSFRHYSERRLLVSIMFYASTGMLFLGAFIMRYRLELVLSFPFLAVVMAVYLYLGFEPGSATQNPESLHREPVLMVSVILCALAMAVLMKVDIPAMHKFFTPTMPTTQNTVRR
jgi:decaprenyl-phosphate phosphoribosyltransferase